MLVFPPPILERIISFSDCIFLRIFHVPTLLNPISFAKDVIVGFIVKYFNKIFKIFELDLFCSILTVSSLLIVINLLLIVIYKDFGFGSILEFGALLRLSIKYISKLSF